MTNIEKYQKVLKTNLGAKPEDFSDEVMVYNRYRHWDSMRHMEIVADLEEAFKVRFETMDILGFSTYTQGIEILKKLGVDMEQ